MNILSQEYEIITKTYHLNRLFPDGNFRDGNERVIENIIEAIKSKSVIDTRSIAQINYTSRSSISRLSKKAGFNNFKESIFFLSNEFSHKSMSQLEALPFVVISQDWDLMSNCFSSAFSGRKIYLFGEGFCRALVNYTYHKLLLRKIYVIDLEGVEVGLVSDQAPYTLITFSQSDEDKNGLLKMEECRKCGGKVIALTTAENSSYAVKSGLSFIVESGSTSIDHKNQNLNCLFGNCLNLMEYLVSHYTKIPKA